MRHLLRNAESSFRERVRVQVRVVLMYAECMLLAIFVNVLTAS